MGPAVTVMLLAAIPPGRAELTEGIALYEDRNYEGALAAFSRAAHLTKSRRDLATVRVYIGIIQFRFGFEEDARANFEAALKRDRRVPFPDENQRAARREFRKIRAALARPRPSSARRARAQPRARTRTLNPGPRRAPPTEVRAEPRAPASRDVTTPPLPRKVARARSNRTPGSAPAPAISAAAGSNATPAPRLDVPPPPPPEPAVALQTSSGGDRSLSTAIALSTSVLGIASGALLTVLANNLQATATDPTTNGRRADMLHGTARQQQAGAIVAFSVGALAGGLAAYLMASD